MTLLDERPTAKPVFEGTKKRGEQFALYSFVIVPFLAFLAAVPVAWGWGLGWTDLGLLLAFYIVSGLGITVGYHRLFTHRSFETHRVVRYAFAVLGEMAVEGDVVTWVAHHRKHHQFSDREGDPHSPHTGHGDGIGEALRGLWHAHSGWFVAESARANRERYAKDLLDDRGLQVIAKLFLPLVLVSMLVPALVCWALVGGWYGFLAGLIWGGAVRIFLLQHVTFSINSICHFFGRRAFATDDESRNVFWLAPFSFGESWHNNHHAFPRSAFHGMRWTQVDPGGLVIRLLEKVGLAWNVVRISAERQAEKRLQRGLTPYSGLRQ